MPSRWAAACQSHVIGDNMVIDRTIQGNNKPSKAGKVQINILDHTWCDEEDSEREKNNGSVHFLRLSHTLLRQLIGTPVRKLKNHMHLLRIK